MNYQLVEVTKGMKFPVGSVVDVDGERVLYRNIEPTRHIFKKGSYQSIAIDDAVVSWIEQNDSEVSGAVFDAGTTAYRIAIDAYKQTKPVHMNGRLQRFVNLERFIVSKPLGVRRPEEKREIVV